jgi:hypothetical protein
MAVAEDLGLTRVFRESTQRRGAQPREGRGEPRVQLSKEELEALDFIQEVEE